MIRILITLVIGGVYGDSPIGAEPTDEDTLDSLFEEYFLWKLKTYPEWASLEGHKGYSHLVEDFSLAGVKRKGEKCQDFLDRSLKLPPADNPDDSIYKDVFESEVKTCVEGMKHKGYLLPPVNFIEGIQVSYPFMIAAKDNTPLHSLKDYEDLLKRLSAIPKMLDEIIFLLEKGMEEGVTYSRHSFNGVDEQFERLQVQVDASQFYKRFGDMPGSLGRHVVDRLQTAAYKVVEEGVLPGFKKLQNFLKFEYRCRLCKIYKGRRGRDGKKGRRKLKVWKKMRTLNKIFRSTKSEDGPGISNNKNGQDFYKAVLKWHISTDQTPEEVHNIGLEEVAKLNEGVKVIIEKMGMKMSTKEFADFIRNDKSQKFSSPEDALSSYKEILTEKIAPQLPKFFPADILTDNVYNVRVKPSPPGGTVAYFENGSKDGSRPGTFYVQLNPLEGQKRYECTTMALHEGNPGHNFQWAFSMNEKNIPRFIANPMFTRYSEAPSRFPMNTAHVEGWGLYSEFLGFELGLYEDDLYARFGHYSGNLLRACRLVIDTGIHALGWSRDEAVKFLLDNTAMSRENVEFEIDRYITWPGQACAYKIGELKIRELRGKAEKEMGAKFQLPEFHRTVLKCVGPLSILERCVESFIREGKSGKGEDYSLNNIPQAEFTNKGERIKNNLLDLVNMAGLAALNGTNGVSDDNNDKFFLIETEDEDN